MAIIDGWLDWAVKIPGIPDKVYTERNRGLGLACHSVVGRESQFEDGIPNRFLSRDRLANGNYTDNAAASCMFILRESGVLIQMYPIWASTWTSGGRIPNTSFWAIEAEGGLWPSYGEQLTPAAEDSFIRLAREWESWSGLPAVPHETMFEHLEFSALYGVAPTACASGRYDTAWLRVLAGAQWSGGITEAEMEEVNQRLKRVERILVDDIQVTADESNAKALAAALGEQFGRPVEPVLGRVYTLSGEPAMLYADAQGMRFLEGLRRTQLR